jgi:hypothetical protein
MNNTIDFQNIINSYMQDVNINKCITTVYDTCSQYTIIVILLFLMTEIEYFYIGKLYKNDFNKYKNSTFYFIKNCLSAGLLGSLFIINKDTLVILKWVFLFIFSLLLIRYILIKNAKKKT